MPVPFFCSDGHQGGRRGDDGLDFLEEFAENESGWPAKPPRRVRFVESGHPVAAARRAAAAVHDLQAQNVLTSIASAIELQPLTGLPLGELVVFRPQRLALHEVWSASPPTSRSRMDRDRGSRYQFPRDYAVAARALCRSADGGHCRDFRWGPARTGGEYRGRDVDPRAPSLHGRRVTILAGVGLIARVTRRREEVPRQAICPGVLPRSPNASAGRTPRPTRFVA